MNLQYQYRFLDVVIRKGEIAIWNKLRVAQSQKLFRKRYDPTANPQDIAEQFIDQYWQEVLDLDCNAKKITTIKSLQQSQELRDQFIKQIFDLAVQYQKQWRQDIYFRFVNTPNLKEGKSTKPDYQIESEDGQQQLWFKFSGQMIDDRKANIKDDLSARFSIAELKKMWLVY